MTPSTLLPVLPAVIDLVTQAGHRLAAEFSRPDGPRAAGRETSPIDSEIELFLRQHLTALFPARFVGEEEGVLAAEANGYCWVVDPHDGTRAFLEGRRGSAVSVGLLFQGRPDAISNTQVIVEACSFSLDEIPQLWNVLRGEMSLVGPRPLPLRDYTRLEAWHRKRYLVLPGVTGLWQISGRSNLGFDDLVRLDFYYLENWSVWMDISILLKTIPAVLSGRGAY